MLSCSWLRARGFNADTFNRVVDDYVLPATVCAVDKTEATITGLRERARSHPRQTLLLAGAVGFVAGLACAARARRR